MIASTVSHAPVCQGFGEAVVSRTLTNVRVTHARMEPTVPTVSIATPAPACRALVASTVRSTLMTALTGSSISNI